MKEKLFIFVFMLAAVTGYAQIDYTLGTDDVNEVTIDANGYTTACTYNFSANTAGTNLTIPATIGSEMVIGITNVTLLADGVFYNKNITSLTLPTTIVHIGNYAFANNDLLTTVDLSNCSELITIGNTAFRGSTHAASSLATVDFSNCTALETIGNSAFMFNHFTMGIDLSDCIALTTIQFNAFSHSSLAALDLSSCTQLAAIGSAAFQYSQLTTLNLSNCTMLTTIGTSAFQGTQLTELDLSNCTALIYIGTHAFQIYYISQFTLPTHAQLSSLGWVDGNSNTYTAGDDATDLLTSYTIPGNGTTYYTITYHLSGGINDVSNPTVYIPTNGIASFAPATKTGYSFLGWYSDDDFTTQVTEIAQGSTANVELWAKWELPVIPISDWAVVLGVFMITIFIVLRFRRKLS